MYYKGDTVVISDLQEEISWLETKLDMYIFLLNNTEDEQVQYQLLIKYERTYNKYYQKYNLYHMLRR